MISGEGKKMNGKIWKKVRGFGNLLNKYKEFILGLILVVIRNIIIYKCYNLKNNL